MKKNIAVIILAAGRGTRMASPIPKVLHMIGPKSMIEMSLQNIKKINPAQIIVVIGYKHHLIKKKLGPTFTYARQQKLEGTADAARAGLIKVKSEINNVLVVNGDDSAFYQTQTIKNIIKSHIARENVLTFVTLDAKDPKGLGRVVRKNGKIVSIVEEKDATAREREIKEINAGLYLFQKQWLITNLNKISASLVTGEYYLVDLIKLALLQKRKINVHKLTDANQWHSINTRQDLESANAKFKSIHFMGIGGAGAAAVAGIADSFGFKISGCDLNLNSPYTSSLNVKIKKGHLESHLKDVDLLVISPAVLLFNHKNPELEKAKVANIPILTWQEFQGKYLQKDKFVISVAGAYGKSTTTSMISKILMDAGLDPTCEIGAKVLDWGANFRVGETRNLSPQSEGRGLQGTVYVCEADEYNNNFLNYEPDIAVILNIGWDHPDFFKSKQSVFESYKKFIARIKKDGSLIVTDNKDLRYLIGFARPDIKIVKVDDFGDFNLSIIGDFRKENAKAALTVAKILGINLEKAKKSVESFRGIGRRLEYRGKVSGVSFYDDYAVQPYTVKVTANALCSQFKNKRVALIFEPHTFSRIKTFFDDFVTSLKQTKVQNILITDVFPARERGNPKLLSQKLKKALGPKATLTGNLKETAKYLKNHLADFDVILSMGAGDVYKLYDMLSKKS